MNEAQLLTSKEFDAIRAGVIGQPLELTRVVNELQAINTPIALLREAMLLGSANPEASNLLALEVKDGNDSHVALLARLQLLKNETLRHWKGSTDPKPAAQRCLRQLLSALTQLQTLDSSHALHNEVKAYANAFAAEASLLAGNPLEAERFALEAKWHAESAGMASVAATVRLQLANIAIYLDQFDLALTQLEALMQSNLLPPSQRDRARRNRAVTLFLIGEEDGAINLLETGDETDYAFIESLKSLTLRYLESDNRATWINRVPNTLAIQARCWGLIATALSMPPTESSQRQTVLRQVQHLLHDLTQTAIGVSALEVQTLSALTALELGSAALAMRKLSAPSKLSVAPAGVGVLNAAVQITVLAALLPESATDLNEALKMLQHHLSKLSLTSQPQQLRKLQLLTPLALVLYSRIGDSSDMALLYADQCILNLKSRPVAVYGVAALRPTTAANMILEAFGREVKQSDHLGGGQLESARRALYHPFGERRYWFHPVCAAQAAFALLCLRGQQSNGYLIDAAVRDLRRRFGYIPNFQQAQPHPQLQTIKTALTLFEEGEITALSAARLLDGEGGSV